MTLHDGFAAHADAWGRTVVEAVGRTYPWAAQHTVTGPDDTDVTPQRLHPAFHGSYDWHSCVHMLWSGLTLLESDGLSDHTRAALVALLDERLQPAHTAAEADVVRRRRTFERPYGWAWLLRLAAAARTSAHPRADAWDAALTPVADAVLEHLAAWLPALTHPVRHGVHSNTAFALGLAHDAAGPLGRADVAGLIGERALAWFGGDRDYPVAWEPSGHDFLSPALSEATLMRRVLDAEAFAAWLQGFVPGLGGVDDPLLTVAEPGDTTDGQAAHLLGLALSRAWHLRELAPFLAPDAAARVRDAATRQAGSAASAITTGDFMATHWLVSFALGAERAA